MSPRDRTQCAVGEAMRHAIRSKCPSPGAVCVSTLIATSALWTTLAGPSAAAGIYFDSPWLTQDGVSGATETTPNRIAVGDLNEDGIDDVAAGGLLDHVDVYL